MPVSFPPPTVPQQAGIESVRGQGKEITSFQSGALRFHLIGANVLSPEQIDSLIHEIRNDTRVNPVFRTARTISLAYSDAGHTATQVLYAVDGQDVYLLATLGPLTRVEAPPALLPYFSKLAGMPAPLDADIEKPRSLAGLHAERIGLDVSTFFVADPDPAAPAGAQILKLQVLQDEQDRNHFGASIGNPGNRFVGRYFSTFDFSHDWTSGDEVGLQWTHNWTNLEKNGKGDHQEALKLSWDRITPLGVFGINGRMTEYAISGASERRSITLLGIDIPLLGQVPGADIDGRIRELELDWLYPLSATLEHRWTINAKLDYSSQRLTAEDASSHTKLQDQELAGIEIGTGYSFRMFESVLPLEVDSQLSLRKGLGKDGRDNPLVGADQSYWLARPKIAITADLTETWSTQMTGFAQIASATLPQHDQWVLGGAEYLYAYVPGVVVGDSGALLGAKLIYQGLPPVWGVDFKLYGLAEYGVANADTAGSFLRGRGLQSVADAGAMIRAQFKPYLLASLSFARGFADHGISQATLDNTRADFYFRVELKL